MPYLPKRNLPMTELDLSAIAEAGRSFQQMYKSLGIGQAMEQITKMELMREEVRKRFAPFEEAAKSFQEIQLAQKAKYQEIFKEITRPLSVSAGSMSFSPPVRPRYPTADEIAEALAKRMKLEKKTTEKGRSEKTVALPPNTNWNELGFDLQDTQSLNLFYKNERFRNYDYEDLKLLRKSGGKRILNRAGQFLEKLALASMEGGRFKPTVEAMSAILRISQNDCHQAKRSLSQKLKKAFGITSSPFDRYDSVSGYRPRFELRPQPLLRDDGEVHRSGSILYDDTTEVSEEE